MKATREEIESLKQLISRQIPRRKLGYMRKKPIVK